MKERKAYGVNLCVEKNLKNPKFQTKEFAEKLKNLDGFLGVTDYEGVTQAALFDSQSNRNKAFKELLKDFYCEVILQTAYIPR